MSIAQQLYEGVDLGEEMGRLGLITYMRTDSTYISPEAINDARKFIHNRFGDSMDKEGGGLIGPDGQPLPDSSGTLQGTRIKIALIASFTGNQVAGTFDVAFSDSSTGTPTSWSWDFGDGHVATRQDPTHSYAKAGDYEVTLTATTADSTSPAWGLLPSLPLKWCSTVKPAWISCRPMA